MKKICTFLLMTIVAFSFAACGGAAENKPVITANANTAKPAPAAPTADALLAMEKAANEAYAKGDSAYFEGMLSDKTMMSMGKDHMNKAAVVAMIKTAKCELTDGVKLSDPQMSKIDNDTYAFAYRNDSAGKCLENGKMVEQKPMRASTIWVRNGEKWQAAWHGETLIIEPKGDAKKDEAKKDEAKKDAAKADVAKKDEAKADVAKKEEPKKEEAKKDDKPAANTASNSNAAAPAPAGPAKSANTEALAKTHSAGWEAFRNKDAKWFDANMSATFAGVNPIGAVMANKADAIKGWTETMKCEGITKTSFNDAFAVAISPTVEILTGHGTADGKCDGQPNGDLDQAAVYVKEGEAWKLAFMFEYTPMPAK